MSGNSTSLTRKALALSALVLVPTLLAAALALRTSLNFMEQAAFDTVEVQATVGAQEVELWLNSKTAEVDFVAAMPAIIDPIANYFTNPKQSLNPADLDAASLGFRSVSVYGPDGRRIAASEDAPVLTEAQIDQALSDGMIVGEARRITRGDDRVLILSAVPAGAGVGIFAAEVPLDGLAEVLPTETPWDSGEISVVQADGNSNLRPITPLRFQDDGAFSNMAPVDGLSLGSDDIFVGVDYRGIDSVGGTHVVEGSPWRVLVKADTDDVMLAPQRVRLIWLVAAGVALLWAALVFAISSRRWQRRVRLLTDAVDDLAVGQSFEPIPSVGRDEIGKLAGSIDRMRENNLHEHDRREEVERELRHQAHHDQLTGQLNRARFMDLLTERLRTARGIDSAVLFCDLDDFKSINDRFGHNAGDQLLTTIADRFATQLEPGEYLARYGGDEFVFLCSSADGRAEELRNELSRSLRAGVEVEGQPLIVEGSIGIAHSMVNEQPSEIVRRADLAMYEVKKNRKSAMLPGGGDRRRETLRGDNELSLAIEENELRLLYQPIICLETGQVTGVEGLVRWRHPEFGLLDPAGIIARADRSGMLDRVDRWVFEQACRQLKAWVVSRSIDDDFSMSVNLSPPLLTDPALVTDLARLLDIYDIDPQMIQVEITEHGLSGVEEQVNRSLNGIKDLGIRIAIDDFGTLHSNLDRLRSFKADALKIDQSFVSGSEWSQESQAILSAILSVARALGVTTIAEGIETLGERRVLTDLGCEFGQGFFFGPPRSAELTAQLLSMSQNKLRWPSS